MRRLLLALLLGLTIVSTAAAQDDDKQRRAIARQELRQLESRVAALAEPPKPSRRELPVPDPSAIALASELGRFIKLYEDLAVANPARRLLVRVHRVNGDAAWALRTLADLREREELDTLRVADRIQGLELRRLYGDLPGAIKTLDGLLQDHPSDPRAEEWRAARQECDRRLAHQQAEVRALGTKRGGAGAARRLHRLQRFAYSWPLRRESAGALRVLLEAMGEAPLSARAGYLERLVFFFPDAKEWLKGTREILGELIRQGEYERALLHAMRLLDKSELLGPGEAERLIASTRQLREYLARIARRPLELRPPTKRSRYEDFVRRCGRGDDAETLRELGTWFVEDYPSCRELSHVHFLLAQALGREDAAAALEHYQAVLRTKPRSEHALPALRRAAPLIEADRGPEEADAFLARNAPLFPQPTDQTRIALMRAALLDKLERWEDARALLEPMESVGDPALAAQVAERLKQIRGRLGG